MANDLRALHNRSFDEVDILDISSETAATLSGTYVLLQKDANTLYRVNALTLVSKLETQD
jgi:hypothetical protein